MVLAGDPLANYSFSWGNSAKQALNAKVQTVFFPPSLNLWLSKVCSEMSVPLTDMLQSQWSSEKHP